MVCRNQRRDCSILGGYDSPLILTIGEVKSPPLFLMFFLTESEQTLLDSVGFLEVTDDLLDRMFPENLDENTHKNLD